MEQLSMCRICLIKDVRMYCLVNTDLQEIYELLTGKLLERKDGRPVDVCYVCFARLRKCLQLRSACLRSEELFTHLLDYDNFDVKPIRVLRNLCKVSLTPTSFGAVVDTELQPKPEPSPSTGDQLDEEHVGDLEDNIVEQGMCTQLIQQQHIKCEDVTLEDDDSIPNFEDEGMCNYLLKQEYMKCEDVTLEDNELYYSIQTTEVQTDSISDNYSSKQDPLESDISKSNHGFTSVKFENICSKSVKIVLHRLDLNSLHKDAAVTEKLTSDDLEDTSTSTSLNNQPQQLIVEANTLHEFKKTEQMSSEVHCSRDRDAFNIVHTRTGEKPFKCGDCGKDFRRRFHLKLHIQTHTGEKPFKCVDCGKDFAQRSYLKHHIRTHTGDKPFKCDKCGKRFRQNCYLITHIRIHTGEKPFWCDVCGKRFRTKNSVFMHNRTHTGEKPFKCITCGKKFADKSSLIRHIRVHTGVKPFKCGTCGKGFTDKSNLLRHIRVHTGEKTFKCDTCGKEFTDRSCLSRHIRLHTGVKPFKCDTCGKGFNENSNLLRHIRVHTGEKIFKCDTCGKEFSDKSCLLRHIRLHTGVKPFQCDTCGKQFAEKSNHARHNRAHTGERPFNHQEVVLICEHSH